MTDRREGVMRAIHANDSQYRLPLEYQTDRDKYVIGAQADAVLAALADDLLPEIREGIDWFEVRMASGFDHAIQRYRGTGPTIPAAIANALNGGDR